MSERRRFFPARRVQTEPGQCVRLEVQLHPQGAAAAPAAQKPAASTDVLPPVWAGYFEHDGAPITVLQVDSVDNAETLAKRPPFVFVAHCSGAVQVQWQAVFHPAVAGVTSQTGDYQLVQQDLPAMSLEPLPPLRQKAVRTLPPTDPNYPWPLSSLPASQQPGVRQLDDPFERPALTHVYNTPGGGQAHELSAPPWHVMPAGNTCTVACLPRMDVPPRWSGRLVLTALIDGQALGSVELHSQHWFYM